ncbi:MAG TPA: response regulator transcription factor [Acetobacteraceae bacterium]|nr:response regulator transcription factor [Acetobacteraceae bacterium]
MIGTPERERDDPSPPRSSRDLLIIEDDPSFARALRRSFERRGYRVAVCDRADALAATLQSLSPAFAVVDLKLIGPSGLECVKILHERDPAMKIVVLTGYASIATAVEAIKLGASHYLAKPSNADDIEAAFEREAGDTNVALSARPSSIKTLEWERIHETLVETEFNISETARRLGMHRRTLARKLLKKRID